MSKIYVDSIASKTGAADAISISSTGVVTMPQVHQSKLPVFKGRLTSNTSSYSSGTWNTVPYNTVDVDSESGYNTSTYAYTPGVAGYYLINAAVEWNNSATDGRIGISKNGTQEPISTIVQGGSGGRNPQISYLIYLDADDYVQIVARSGDTSAIYGGTSVDACKTFLSIVCIRAGAEV